MPQCGSPEIDPRPVGSNSQSSTIGPNERPLVLVPTGRRAELDAQIALTIASLPTKRDFDECGLGSSRKLWCLIRQARPAGGR